MKKIRIILMIILVISMLFILTACESNKNDKDEDTLGYISTRNSNNSKQDAEKTTKESNEGKFMNDVKKISSEEALQNAEKQMANPEKGETIAVFHIKNYGDITVKFFENIAPKAVENFITHAKEGYYDGVIFHRVIENFMIQGGDPEGTGYGGESIWGEGFDEELDSSVLPYKGALCMASGGTGTSSLGSQFYIVQADYSEAMELYLDHYGISNLKDAYKQYGGDLADLVGYGQYTTFGQVIEGIDIVDKIAKVETNEKDKPLEDVVIESIEIKEY